jgi:hypothetical protein
MVTLAPLAHAPAHGLNLADGSNKVNMHPAFPPADATLSRSRGVFSPTSALFCAPCTLRNIVACAILA